MLRRPNIHLPFFAYGPFKPGQIAYSRIENHIKSKGLAECNHKLFLRDGLPFICEHSSEHDVTKGYLIKFNNDCKWDAYNIICEVASEKLYDWKVIGVQGNYANALIGLKPSKSNPLYIGTNFDGGEDPYFKEAIETIKESIAEYKYKYKDSKKQLDEHEQLKYKYKDSKKQLDEHEQLMNYFKLLRNYVLLWASIERYISLRYGKSYEVKGKEKFAREIMFQESLRRHIGGETRDIFRTDNLDKITLDANCPEDSIDYYYTIRCNIVHRGKTPDSKDETVLKSLEELLGIFIDVLNDTFN